MISTAELRGNHLDMTHSPQLLGKLLSEHIKQYPAHTDINEVEFRVYSQFGEDGIIQFITGHLIDEIKNKIFIEIGVQDYNEANTRFLLENNTWKGVVIDCSEEYIQKIQYSDFFWRNHLFAINKFITKDNIGSVIHDLKLPGDIGLFSLDIDGNDYWVLKNLFENNLTFKPSIIIVEYNSFFGDELPISIPYKENFIWQQNHPAAYFGASLPAFCFLLGQYGYDLLGSTKAGNNAFFIRRDINKGKLKTVTPKEGYKQAIFNSIPCRTFYKFDEQRLSLRYQQLVDVRNNDFVRVFEEEKSIVIQNKFNCIEDFIIDDDECFIINAYQYLLCRAPAKNEVDIFLDHLTKGTTKTDILKMIRFSEEGRGVGVYVFGLCDESLLR